VQLLKMMKKSIQVKVTVIAVVSLFISLSILGICNFYNARNIIIADAEEALAEQAEANAREIALWNEMRKGELSILATNQSVVNGDTEVALNYLASEAKRNPIYSRFWVVNAQGQAIHTTRDRTNIVDRDYFKQVMSTGEVVVTDPIISKVDGKMVVSVVAPIKRDNRIVGVLGGTVTVDSLIARINEIKVAQTGYAYVIQGNGLTIFHPDKERVMKNNALTDQDADSKLKEITNKMVSGEKGIASYVENGATKYIAYSPIGGSHWSLGINVPENEILTKTKAFTITSISLIALILIVTCGFGIVASRRLTKPIVTLNKTVEKVAQGDLTIQTAGLVQHKSSKADKDELDTLAANFNMMVVNLNNLVQQISVSAEQVAVSSEELTASAEQSAQSITQVAGSVGDIVGGTESALQAVDEASAVVEQMSAGIQQAAASSNQVAAHSAQAADKAKEGNASVVKAVTQMTQVEQTVNNSAQVVAKLGERSKEIGQIVDAISGIAGQTNLLALNAAIEAARAGEQGRGFAVVAEEVRKLAEQSQDAAKQIATLIGEIQGDTDKAVAAMDEGTREVKIGAEVVTVAGKAFEEIASLVTSVSEQVREISAVMQQLASGSQQIVLSVRTIDSISKNTAEDAQTVSAAAEGQSASMEEIAASSQSLAKMAEALQQVICKFKI